MFAVSRRRLTLFNVGLVACIVAAVVLTTYVVLRTSLQRSAEHDLMDRIGLAKLTWHTVIIRGEPVRSQDSALAIDDDGDDAADGFDPLHEVLETGDTLTFVFDEEGVLLVNERGIETGQLPARDEVARALNGDTVSRTANAGGQSVRMRTEPVWVNGRIVGAVQAVRSDREHQHELGLVRNIGLAGIVLGLMVSFPTGMLLTRRAMVPMALAFERQRAFIGDASHELRTPLSVIRSNVELIAREPDMSAQERAAELQQVLTEIDDMARMVGALVTLAGLDRPVEPGATSANVLDIVHAVTRQMQPFAIKAGISLVSGGQDATVAVDPKLIRQVLRILLENAIAYTDRGGNIDVSVVAFHDHVTISVVDSGIGIAPADLTRVFDRFFRADRARSRNTGGAGLGLAIAKASVTALGGDIRLASTPGYGTRVTIILPSGS